MRHCIDAKHLDLPFIGRDQCRNDPDERALAAAIWAENADDLTRFDGEIDSLERMHRIFAAFLKCFLDSMEFEGVDGHVDRSPCAAWNGLTRCTLAMSQE